MNALADLHRRSPRPVDSQECSAALASREIAHHLDDWAEKGGHHWPY
jgi:hypothetical protein